MTSRRNIYTKRKLTMAFAFTSMQQNIETLSAVYKALNTVEKYNSFRLLKPIINWVCMRTTDFFCTFKIHLIQYLYVREHFSRPRYGFSCSLLRLSFPRFSSPFLSFSHFASLFLIFSLSLSFSFMSLSFFFSFSLALPPNENIGEKIQSSGMFHT